MAGISQPGSSPLKQPGIEKKPTRVVGKNKENHVQEDLLEVAVVTVGVAKEAVGIVNVPGLAAGFSALLEILKKIQVMSKTVKGVGDLTRDVDNLAKAAAAFSTRNPGRKIPEGLQESIDELTSKWKKVGERAEKLANRGKWRRFIRSASDCGKLESLVGEISSSIQRALLRGGWDIQLAIGEVQQTLDAMADQQDEKFMPPHAESAAYDANSARPRQPCLEGTREDILGDAWTWIKLHTWDSTPTDNSQGQGGALVSTQEAQGFIHWTCGLAGTGKTTIACSIAKRCKEEGILGASFFFSRFDSKCDNTRLLFTTISRQLCRVHPAYRAKVIAIMKNNPDITNSVAAVQFEKLILEPLEQLTEPFPLLTIVVDALDECHCDDSTSTIFHILSRFKDRIIRFFLFILTSRPEPDIVAHFDQSRSGPLGEVTMRLCLHTVQLEPVYQDIRRILTRHLRGTLDRRVPRGWPSDENIATLANLSEGLFIFARTAINLIMDKSSMDPVRTLDRVVQRQSDRSHTVSVLEELYRQVLDEAHPKADEELQDSIRRIVGTLVVAAEPLSVTTLAALLGLEDRVVWHILSGLYPVLHIPDDDSQPIHFIHPTFPEFLLQASPAPPLPPRFSFSAIEQHASVLVRCLKTTGALLRYDIADLREPGAFKKDISGLLDNIQQCIPSHLSYACRNWSVHFKLGSGTPELTTAHTLLSEFLHQHLLCWLEACILLNTLAEASAALDTARHTCQSLEEPFANLVPFLLDARRFTLMYGPLFDSAPLQIYHSALGLAPSSSLVSQTYSRVRRKESLAVCRGALHEWESGLAAFAGHNGKKIWAVAFSPDNVFFVSGGEDGMVKVWQASTRVLLLDIQAPGGWIQAIAYSPDGLHIAVGGWKGISLWHAASGAHIRTIAGDDIRHVAYTADGSCVLSVSHSGKVQLWRVSDGECLLSLEGGGWRQAGISSDGVVIAFTRGASLLLHDVSSGEREQLELPVAGQAAAFSPDGSYVAAATEHAIRIWSRQDKSLVRSIDVLAHFCTRLSFSPDGSKFCCGCINGSVYVWLVKGRGPAHELKGHTNRVWDVSWSPDGSQIVSASGDGTVQLWDVTDPLPRSQSHTLPERSSSGSPCVSVAKCRGQVAILDLLSYRIADLFLPSRDDTTAKDAPTFTSHPNRASAWDHVIHSTTMWQPAMFHRWAALTGQNTLSRGATTAISNDGSLVAYPAARNICIRRLRTGEVVATLTPEFESGDVLFLAFSPDDALLASGSQHPVALAVWDVAAGACVAYHHDHAGYVCCVTFSSDGRFVVSGSDDGTARVFDIHAQRVTAVLEEHQGWVMYAMLTADDRLLVTQYYGGALYIWDIETGSRIASFPPSDELWITDLRFSHTGFSISAEDGEHTVNLWKVGERVWPVYYISKDGWVYAKGPGYTRRLAWLPPEWRHLVCCDGAMLCVCEVVTNNIGNLLMRKLIELDMSGVLDRAGISYNR